MGNRKFERGKRRMRKREGRVVERRSIKMYHGSYHCNNGTPSMDTQLSKIVYLHVDQGATLFIVYLNQGTTLFIVYLDQGTTLSIVYLDQGTTLSIVYLDRGTTLSVVYLDQGTTLSIVYLDRGANLSMCPNQDLGEGFHFALYMYLVSVRLCNCVKFFSPHTHAHTHTHTHTHTHMHTHHSPHSAQSHPPQSTLRPPPTLPPPPPPPSSPHLSYLASASSMACSHQ